MDVSQGKHYLRVSKGQIILLSLLACNCIHYNESQLSFKSKRFNLSDHDEYSRKTSIQQTILHPGWNVDKHLSPPNLNYFRQNTVSECDENSDESFREESSSIIEITNDANASLWCVLLVICASFEKEKGKSYKCSVAELFVKDSMKEFWLATNLIVNGKYGRDNNSYEMHKSEEISSDRIVNEICGKINLELKISVVQREKS